MCIVECLCVCLCLFVCLSFFLCLFLSVCLSVFLFTWPTGPMLLLVSDCVCPATGAIAPLLGAPTSRTTGLGDIVHFGCVCFFNFYLCVTFNWSSSCFVLVYTPLWMDTSWQLPVGVLQGTYWQFAAWSSHATQLFPQPVFPAKTTFYLDLISLVVWPQSKETNDGASIFKPKLECGMLVSK